MSKFFPTDRPLTFADFLVAARNDNVLAHCLVLNERGQLTTEEAAIAAALFLSEQNAMLREAVLKLSIMTPTRVIVDGQTFEFRPPRDSS